MLSLLEFDPKEMILWPNNCALHWRSSQHGEMLGGYIMNGTVLSTNISRNLKAKETDF